MKAFLLFKFYDPPKCILPIPPDEVWNGGISFLKNNIKTEWLNDQIKELLHRIEPNYDTLCGVKCQLSLCIYNDGQWNPGILLDQVILNFIQKWKASIDIDFYIDELIDNRDTT